MKSSEGGYIPWQGEQTWLNMSQRCGLTVIGLSDGIGFDVTMNDHMACAINSPQEVGVVVPAPQPLVPVAGRAAQPSWVCNPSQGNVLGAGSGGAVRPLSCIPYFRGSSLLLVLELGEFNNPTPWACAAAPPEHVTPGVCGILLLPNCTISF